MVIQTHNFATQPSVFAYIYSQLRLDEITRLLVRAGCPPSCMWQLSTDSSLSTQSHPMSIHTSLMITQLEPCIRASHNLDNDKSILFIMGPSLTVSESENPLSKVPPDLSLISSQLEEYFATSEISCHELLAWRVGFITSSNAFY